MFRLLIACLVLGGIVFANDLTVVNEVAGLIQAKVIDVRPEAALVDAGAAGKDAGSVRDRLDGVVLREALTASSGAEARAFTIGVRTVDQRLVVFRLQDQTIVWSSTTLEGELRLLPGFRNGEVGFVPDFDYSASAFNRLRYGGTNVADDLDFELRCTSSPDSNGSTLSCANGYGREVFYSRCYLTLEGSVVCEPRPG